jgi:alpha-glucosidase (family GH31 glycosyl hydrolase)
MMCMAYLTGSRCTNAVRAEMKPYVKQLALNVTATGVPTVRPLWCVPLDTF